MYQLFCDTNSEIPFEWAEELGLGVIRMPYTIGGREYLYDLGRETDFKAFFDRVRKGEMPQTQGLNEQNYSGFLFVRDFCRSFHIPKIRTQRQYV